MLVLGAEILIGFQFTATFQSGFKQLAFASREANLIALTLTLITVAFLLSPPAFHQITMKGNDSPSVVRFTIGVMKIALFPFALALGASLFIPAREIAGPAAGIVTAIAATGVAFLFWYGPGLLPAANRSKGRKDTPAMESGKKDKSGPTALHDKIRQILTEARVILPGNQALLGFQLTVILQQSFRDLQPALQRVHLASLLLMALSTVLLLTPAPYHRIVEHGEETEGFYRVASFLVLSSLPPLAAGICGDFFVVVFSMTRSWLQAIIAVAFMVLVFATMWLAYPWFRRARQQVLAQS